jgi:uncharacterized membrane protein
MTHAFLIFKKICYNEKGDYMEKLALYFLLFMTYSFIGWSIEVIGKLIEKHKFINRGFLIGPYCPIYGFGCIIITLCLYKYLNDPIVLFIMSIFICSVLEYLTSYYMEKIFGLRWWDYSRRKFNLNGRICLETMIPFGILSLFVMYIVNPFFMNVYSKLPSTILYIICLILLILYITDNIITTTIMFGFRKTINTLDKDGTEEITKKVKEKLVNRNWLYKRLLNAFPNLKNPKEYLQEVRINLEKEITKQKEFLKEQHRNK